MPATCLIGHSGFVGSNLAQAHSFDQAYNSKTISDIAGKRYDLLVCAAPQAVKWWANKHPESDFAAVKSLLRHLEGVSVERFVLISTIDTFPVITKVDESFDCTSAEIDPYGQHRLMLEQQIQELFPHVHIVRLPGLFGRGLKKNILFDMLQEHQVEKINPASKFQWYDLGELWADLQRVIESDLKLVVLATEPIETEEIRGCFFPNLDIGGDPNPPIFYDVRTMHGPVFGGADGYIMSAGDILERIGRFVASEKSRVP